MIEKSARAKPRGRGKDDLEHKEVQNRLGSAGPGKLEATQGDRAIKAAGGTKAGEPRPRSVKGAGDDTGELPPLLGQTDQEIVATNLSPHEVAELKVLGFQAVAPTRLANAGTVLQPFRVPSGMSRNEAQAMIAKELPLVRVGPNQIYRIFSSSSGEAERGGCAGGTCAVSQLIKWRNDLAACAKEQKIGIIDTSFDLSHAAFAGIKASSGEFLGAERPAPSDWHGTAVLSLLAGDAKSGVPGLVPGASFYLASAFRSDERGNAVTDTVRLLAALDWLDQVDVQYVNMSFSGPKDALLEAAIKRMRKKGVVFIAAAGNNGPTAPPSYPAAYPDVIAVTAVNQTGDNYRHANRGSYIDVSAPGVGIPVALPDAGTGVRSGTSFAAPIVTAIVATQIGKAEALLDKRRVLGELTLQDLGPPGPDPIYGQGLALAPQECKAAVQSASRPMPPPTMGLGALAGQDR